MDPLGKDSWGHGSTGPKIIWISKRCFCSFLCVRGVGFCFRCISFLSWLVGLWLETKIQVVISACSKVSGGWNRYEASQASSLGHPCKAHKPPPPTCPVRIGSEDLRVVHHALLQSCPRKLLMRMIMNHPELGYTRRKAKSYNAETPTTRTWNQQTQSDPGQRKKEGIYPKTPKPLN